MPLTQSTISPSALMAAVRARLSKWCADAGLRFLEASDPFNVFDLLMNRPDAGCVVSLWEGDQPHAQVAGALVVVQELSLSLTRPTRFRDRASAASDGTISPEPILQAVSELRAMMLALRVSGVTEYVRYGGCAPLVAPSGVPLDGYRMTFRLMAAAPIDTTTVLISTTGS